MGAFGYIFLAQDKQQFMVLAEQQDAILEYGRSIGCPVESLFIEEAGVAKRPLKDRPEGANLLKRCGHSDAIIVVKAAWVLSSAASADRLIRELGKQQIALHCIDLGGNISVPEKRRLMVYEGTATIVGKLLSALVECESSKHGQAIKAAKKIHKEEGKYLGGPVPFGWEVNQDGFLAPCEAQQEIIKTIAALRHERWSYRDISKKLKKDLNVHLSYEGVRRILAGKAGKVM